MTHDLTVPTSVSGQPVPRRRVGALLSGMSLIAWQAAGFLLLAGCGPRDLVPVNGTVTLDGKPIEWANLGFHPQDLETGRGGVGYTDRNGRFLGITLQGRRGLYRGEYAVTISARVPADGKYPGPDATQEELDRGFAQAREIFPRQYLSPETTPLKVKIDGSQGPLDFQVESERPAGRR